MAQISCPPPLYDAPEEAEPRFLSEEAAGDDLPPGPRAERDGLFDPVHWLAAQGSRGGDLAGACSACGRLDARLQAAGMPLRLALHGIADLGWHTGARIGLEHLALFVALRIAAVRACADRGATSEGREPQAVPVRDIGHKAGARFRGDTLPLQ